MSSDEEAIRGEESSSDGSEEERVQAYHDLITERNFTEYFDAARRLVAAKDYEDGCVLLRALILKGSELFGSASHVRLAAAYFETGHALLESLEQTPQAFVQEEGAESGSQASVQEIEMAWENLEVARTVLERYLREQPNLEERERRGYQSLLANVHLRLGDLQNWKEDFSAALGEYAASLTLLRQIEDPASSRRVAELHFLMGNTHVYNFAADTQALEDALECYRQGREVIACLQARAEGEAVIEMGDLLQGFDLKIAEVSEELANKQQIIEELAKIRDITEQRESFAKSVFDEQRPRQLGKFVAGKKIPEELSENSKPLTKVQSASREEEDSAAETPQKEE